MRDTRDQRCGHVLANRQQSSFGRGPVQKRAMQSTTESNKSSADPQQPSLEPASRSPFHLVAEDRRPVNTNHAQIVFSAGSAHSNNVQSSSATANHAYAPYASEEQLRHRSLGYYQNHCMTTNAFGNGLISSSSFANQASYSNRSHAFDQVSGFSIAAAAAHRSKRSCFECLSCRAQFQRYGHTFNRALCRRKIIIETLNMQAIRCLQGGP